MPGVETTAEHISQHFENVVNRKERVESEKTCEHSGSFWEANGILTRFASASKVLVVQSAAKAALAVSNAIAENGYSSSYTFVADLSEEIDGNSRAEATLSRGSAENGDENTPKDAGAPSAPDE